jgi:hypothetical protein
MYGAMEVSCEILEVPRSRWTEIAVVYVNFDGIRIWISTVEDEWQLAVKDTILGDKINQYGHPYQEIKNSNPPIPLLKSSRVMRIKATRLIPDLLDELKSEAEQLLNSIDEAEAAAKKL